MKAIVCDVGHTIITGSILNLILSDIGKSAAAATLYDEYKLSGLLQNDIDTWVTEVAGVKLRNLTGVTVEQITNACAKVSYRRGFPEFAGWIGANEIPTLFVGTVPRMITVSMLSLFGLETGDSHIAVEGSVVDIENGRVSGHGRICTPSSKRDHAITWARRLKVALEDLAVIGDSIGDVPTMLLTPRTNRFSVNPDSASLNRVAGHVVSDFHEIIGLLGYDAAAATHQEAHCEQE